MINGLGLDADGKIDIPEDKTRLKIDVGLSWDAPNTALWLKREKDLFVIGIEPNIHAINAIRSRGTVLSMAKNTVPVEINESNFMLLECAIDNVYEPIRKAFYHMSSTDDKWDGCPGCSSLLPPTEKLLGNKQCMIDDSDVDVVPFTYVLGMIPWDRFMYIDLVKTDCQGKDLDVVLSAGAYLSRIAYLNCELTTFGNYYGETVPHDFLYYLNEKGFKRISRRGGEFVNERLERVAKRDGVSNKCMNI